MKKRLLYLILLTFLYSHSIGQKEKSTAKTPESFKGQYSQTQQRVTIDGQTINLTARAGTMQVRDENNDPIALFGFTSYTKDTNSDERPHHICLQWRAWIFFLLVAHGHHGA